MDIKEVKEEVKEEIKKDEELLVKVFQLEKFIKKYKKPLIAAGVIVVALFIGSSVYTYYKTSKLIKENDALSRLLQNPNDKEALEIVKQNKELYSLYMLKRGEYDKITSKALEEFKAYKLAMQKGDIQSLEAYLNNPNYHILKDAVRLALIRAYLKDNKRDRAKMLADEIDPQSKFKELAKYLIHYGIVNDKK
ncbi:MAG: tetratricopeptide repeat protein [Epsilonproteobacteria bacterium]|nr:tetratricopeptide repeat protein [Campylobacterota bacterium]